MRRRDGLHAFGGAAQVGVLLQPADGRVFAQQGAELTPVRDDTLVGDAAGGSGSATDYRAFDPITLFCHLNLR